MGKNSSLLVAHVLPDGFQIPRRNVAEFDGMDQQFRTKCESDLRLVPEADVDVQPAFVELVLDEVHDFAAQPAIQLDLFGSAPH